MQESFEQEFEQENIEPIANLGFSENRISPYLEQFNDIRCRVKEDLNDIGNRYVASVYDTTRGTLELTIKQHYLAREHAKLLLQKLCGIEFTGKVLNSTIYNAMLEIEGLVVLVDFDLFSDKPVFVSNLRPIRNPNFSDSKQIQKFIAILDSLELMIGKSYETEEIKEFKTLLKEKHKLDAELHVLQNELRETINARLVTAYDLAPGLEFYTLAVSEDKSMLFWDRYEIVNDTAKSLYIEQHCIIEHCFSGIIEQEKFITLHKPSKNSVAWFLSTRLACLTELQRPIPISEIEL